MNGAVYSAVQFQNTTIY